MSNNPPTTPPEGERSLSYVSDAQRTPTSPRTAGPLACSSGRDHQVASRYNPYRPPPPKQRRSRSRAPSPTPMHTPRSASADPIGSWKNDRGLGGDSDDEEDDIMKDESTALFTISHSEDDPIASNTTPAPSNEAQRKFADLQSNIQSSTQKAVRNDGFNEHISKVEKGKGRLFPENTVISSHEPTEIPLNPNNSPVFVDPAPGDLHLLSSPRVFPLFALNTFSLVSPCFSIVSPSFLHVSPSSLHISPSSCSPCR